ncbi:MAG: XdhC family protein [Rhodoglobus sp.]
MFEIADRLLAAADTGKRLAVATAISIEGSAPRTVGTSMAFDGEAVIGSIAGGCVEGAVVEACVDVLADGAPRTVEYGVSDETALSVGLTCGGQLRIHIQLLDASLLDSLRAGTAVEVCREFTEQPPVERRMIIFGAMEFSAALAAAAAPMGYRVTVCDPRSLVATAERFPRAELVVQWPTSWLEREISAGSISETTVICVLSHDARFDAELIELALASSAGYVGAMGSRTTHDRRVASLAERGVTDLGRLHSPIGLDLGGSTPEETAISILAEVLAVRSGAGAEPLRDARGAIHGTLPGALASQIPRSASDAADPPPRLR